LTISSVESKYSRLLSIKAQELRKKIIKTIINNVKIILFKKSPLEID